MKRYTQKEFDLFPLDNYGRKQCPSGDYTLITKFPKRCSFDGLCYFGVKCFFSEQCSFGERCFFGEHCSFGRFCSFGMDCSFGAECFFCKFCSFGRFCSFGMDCSFGRFCSFGMDCSFGKCCSFGDRCVFGEFCTFGEDCKCEFGIFQAMYTAGGFGSARRTTYFFHMLDDRIYVRCGCFAGTIDAWENRVKKTHGFNRYAQAYVMIGGAVRAICQNKRMEDSN